MRRKIFAGLFVIALILILFILQMSKKFEPAPYAQIEGVTLPRGCTLNEYAVAKIYDTPCKKNAECSMPSGFVSRSSCPFVAICIEGKCAVVSPSFIGY
jgi:hypothetical protein